jgi:transcriptional regulator with XRE-family HTH domain
MTGEPALGLLLRFLREQRGLSLRELGRLAGVDHAYIHRLETGGKEAPSAEVIGKLAKALKAGKRELDMLLYLADHPETSGDVVERTMKDPTIAFDVFVGVAGIANRGKRPNLETIIERVRSFLDEEGGNG